MLCKSSATTISSLKVCTLTYVHSLSLSLLLILCAYSLSLEEFMHACFLVHVFWILLVLVVSSLGVIYDKGD